MFYSSMCYYDEWLETWEGLRIGNSHIYPDVGTNSNEQTVLVEDLWRENGRYKIVRRRILNSHVNFQEVEQVKPSTKSPTFLGGNKGFVVFQYIMRFLYER